MDQVKAILAVAVRHGFWIGCIAVLIGSVAIWYMSTGTLNQETQEQASKINQAVTTVRNVQAEVNTLPNDQSHAEMEKLIEARQNEVLEAWQLLYERQREILKWPVDELQDEFVDKFKDLIPIERHVEFPLKEEVSGRIRDRYDRYIKNVLPRIAKIGNTEWANAKKDPNAPQEDDLSGLGDEPLVMWSSSNQDEVEKDLFPWSGSTPDTLQIYYSQENLWILEQLMKIVATVNGDAKQPYQAKIREILKIGIGSSVTFDQPAMISRPGATASGMGAGGGGGGGGASGMPAALEGVGFGGMGGPAGGGAAATERTKDPADERYVDLKMQAIKATKLRSALKSKQPSDASLAVAKRVPVMLSVNMDQRAVPELLAVCGSADLMVEVKQVRMLQKGASAAASSGGGGMGGMGMGGGFGGGGGGGGMMGGGDMEALASGGDPLLADDDEDDEEFPLDMNVEIYGIISIYNPPDRTQLGLKDVTKKFVDEEEAAEIEASGSAPTQPAATPAQSNDVLPTPQADEAAPAGAPAATPGDAATPADGAAPADGQPAPAESEPAEPEPAAPTPVAAGGGAATNSPLPTGS